MGANPPSAWRRPSRGERLWCWQGAKLPEFITHPAGGRAGRLQTHFSLWRPLQIRLRAVAHLLSNEQRQDCSVFPERRFRRTGFLPTPVSALGDFFFLWLFYILSCPTVDKSLLPPGRFIILNILKTAKNGCLLELFGISCAWLRGRLHLPHHLSPLTLVVVSSLA